MLQVARATGGSCLEYRGQPPPGFCSSLLSFGLHPCSVGTPTDPPSHSTVLGPPATPDHHPRDPDGPCTFPQNPLKAERLRRLSPGKGEHRLSPRAGSARHRGQMIHCSADGRCRSPARGWMYLLVKGDRVLRQLFKADRDAAGGTVSMRSRSPRSYYGAPARSFPSSPLNIGSTEPGPGIAEARLCHVYCVQIR